MSWPVTSERFCSKRQPSSLIIDPLSTKTHLIPHLTFLYNHQIILDSNLTISKMDSPKSSLFQVYLRLRPPPLQVQSQSLYPQLPSSTGTTASTPERFLTVEPPSPTTPACVSSDNIGRPTHITIHPPSDSRKRAVEKFGFTRVFEEQTAQLDVFEGTGARGLVEGVLGEGRDGLLATLGVTGSGKVSPPCLVLARAQR